MGKICWDFPLKGSGNEQGYTDSGIELFKGKELLENLAREICQNSLDARDPNADGPVEVKFSLRMIQKSHLASGLFSLHWYQRTYQRVATIRHLW